MAVALRSSHHIRDWAAQEQEEQEEEQQEQQQEAHEARRSRIVMSGKQIQVVLHSLSLLSFFVVARVTRYVVLDRRLYPMYPSRKRLQATLQHSDTSKPSNPASQSYEWQRRGITRAKRPGSTRVSLEPYRAKPVGTFYGTCDGSVQAKGRESFGDTGVLGLGRT